MSHGTTRYGTIETSQPDEPPDIVSDTEAAPESRRTRSVARSICYWFWVVVLVAIIAFVAFVLWFQSVVACTSLYRPPVFGRPSWAEFKNQSFHVGFDLTAGYGTASVVFDNGTIVDVGRAEGTKEYNELFAHYSLPTSRRPSPPYRDCKAEWDDLPRQWRRYVNKKLNRPVSSDVTALAAVLGPLKDQVDDFLGDLGSVEVAFIVVPYLPALYNEELLDAGHAVGIQMLTLPSYVHRSGDQGMWPVTELNAAYVGSGFGMTPDSRGLDLWDGNLFSVLYTKRALAAYVMPLNGEGTHFYAASGITNFSLGSAALETDGLLASEENYWDEVRLALGNAMDEDNGRSDHLGRVVSYGESAYDATFQRVLEEEVTARQKDETEKEGPVFRIEHATYAGARGAAIFATQCPKILPRPGDCFPDLTPKMPDWF